MSAPVGGNSASYTTPALTVTTAYWVRVTNTCSNGTAFTNSPTATVTVAGPLSAPAGLLATFNGGSIVQLSWAPVSGATSYEIFGFSTLNSAAALIGTSTTASWQQTVQVGFTYLYRVKAVAGSTTSPFSSFEFASTFSFTDPVLTVIRAVHVDQLRQAIDSLRLSANLTAVWGSSGSVTGQTIQAAHFTQMRDALTAARTQFGYSTTFTNVPLQIHVTPVYASHITELRDGTK